MKKQTLRYHFILFSVILVFSLVFITSCSKSLAAGDSDASYNKSEIYYENSSDSGIGTLPTGGTENPNAKIIKNASAEIRTLTYDDFTEKLYLKITELGGYTDSESFSGSAPYRYAYITIRIPADKLDDFKTELSSLGTLTRYSATKQDVTLTYTSLKAKVDTLKLEADAVEELFEKAKTTNDLAQISSLQSKLYDLRLEINQAEAQLAAYDNSIAYSTVKLTVNEIKEHVVVEPEKKNAFERIGENLKENLSDIGNFFVDFFVWFVSAIPYFIIFGVIGTGAVFIIIAIKKRRSVNSNEDFQNDKNGNATNENSESAESGESSEENK
ncbi:MAG: DUF4349 domain-containing protein [Clostridia bacterium]|nr:DUF4349 domain-containing protein [Clostridia bacterium]